MSKLLIFYILHTCFTTIIPFIKKNNENKSRISDVENEAVKALVKLGYKNKEAAAMIEKVEVGVGDTTEDVIKKVLRKK